MPKLYIKSGCPACGRRCILKFVAGFGYLCNRCRRLLDLDPKPATQPPNSEEE